MDYGLRVWEYISFPERVPGIFAADVFLPTSSVQCVGLEVEAPELAERDHDRARRELAVEVWLVPT